MLDLCKREDRNISLGAMLLSVELASSPYASGLEKYVRKSVSSDDEA
jgi:hypothetical protein